MRTWLTASHPGIPYATRDWLHAPENKQAFWIWHRQRATREINASAVFDSLWWRYGSQLQPCTVVSGRFQSASLVNMMQVLPVAVSKRQVRKPLTKRS
jgi:hypothetical protein